MLCRVREAWRVETEAEVMNVMDEGFSSGHAILPAGTSDGIGIGSGH